MKRIYGQLGGFLLLLFLPFLLAGFIWRNYYFVIFAVLWFLLISRFMLRWVRTPLSELLNYLENLRAGNPARNRLSRREDIYGELAKNLDQLERANTSHLSTLHGRMEEIQAILTSMSEGVVATDITGRISLINPAAAELFSLRPGQGVGDFPYRVFPQSELGEIFHQVFVKGYPMEREISWPGNPGKVLNLHLALIIDEVDEIRGVVAVIGDITKLRQLETVRKDFVANVSHELKTPLTSIKGFIETLLDGALEDPTAGRHFLSVIDQETKQLNNLIDDLLDISKIESGQTELHKQPVDLEQLLAELLVSLEGRLREKKLELTRDLAVHLVPGDPDLLREVLLNLLDNAIKYSPEGGMIVVSSRRSDQEVQVLVRDTGIGIPSESLSRIFERFYRVDKGRSRAMGGTGLGLAIVKHIVERHGGQVTVSSKLGEGSEFCFSLPLKKSSQAEEQEDAVE